MVAGYCKKKGGKKGITEKKEVKKISGSKISSSSERGGRIEIAKILKIQEEKEFLKWMDGESSKRKLEGEKEDWCVRIFPLKRGREIVELSRQNEQSGIRTRWNFCFT